jgi:hypothetical protein
MGSLSLDFDSIWTQAVAIINNLWVIFAIPLGVVFGFAILAKIIREIRSAVGSA